MGARENAALFRRLAVYRDSGVTPVLRGGGPLGRHLWFWLVALLVGCAAGATALGFRHGIIALQNLAYGTEDMSRLHSIAGTLHPLQIFLIPIAGGLIVGLILHYLTPDGRARSVADVIEGAALNDGRVERRAGLASMLASLITLGTGGSSGREGPVVHFAAVISSWVNERLGTDGVTGRDLLGCAVAAAVAASFNAPIAGAIFALEVVLRHFAIHAFGPIVVASVAGSVINRTGFGDVPEFVLPHVTVLEFYVELPAFLLLGLVCGTVAAALIYAIFLVEDAATALWQRSGVPRWLRPTLAGAVLGAMAILFPPIIGVGYETTFKALTGELGLREAIIIAVVKVVAVAVTLGGRMGGGVFSPSLMLGALTGLAFGYVATSVFPNVSGEVPVYALAGMGALAAAVLGAPISTILIVFEMTGDWQTGIAVMTAVATSVTISARLVKRSFFLTQLERRDIHLAAGPQQYLLNATPVSGLLRPVDEDGPATEEACWRLIERGIYIDQAASLAGAFPVFERATSAFLPVVTLGGEGRVPELKGVIFHVDALKAYTQALTRVSEEEHG